jgi:hypothetical protein
VKKELYDTLDEIIHSDDNMITNFFLTFKEKSREKNRFGKAIPKKRYTILEEEVKKLKFQ